MPDRDMEEEHSALNCFPEDIWEIILGKLEDSRDVMNAFISYPELEGAGVLKTKRHLWLFDQVIPHLFPWISQVEFLYCRRVCKQWSRAIDNFVENHPYHRAYDHEIKITGQHWIPEASQAHYELPSYFGGVKPFIRTNMFGQFNQDMDEHTLGRNPFIGRSISISDFELLRKPVDELELFWNEALYFMTKFGVHIWYLKLEIIFTDEISSHQVLLKLLHRVPNLKGLGIVNNNENHRHSDNFLEWDMESFFLPPLSRLETLEIKYPGLSGTLTSFFVWTYSTQLRRMRLHFQYWREEYAHLFPNLTEFSLHGVNLGKDVSDVLHNLNSPKLFILEIQLPCDFGEASFIFHNVALLLIRFPKISSLTMSPSPSGVNGSVIFESIVPVIPSLISFTVWGRGRELIKMFPCFPSIQFFKVKTTLELKYLVRSMYLSNLWKTNITLKEITLVGCPMLLEERKIHYDRAVYDKLAMEKK